jgi:predicted RNase H-like nuclease (RuvC/YqgF family)
MIFISGYLNAQRKYPIQTLFKGDSVVILKYDQAIEINNLLLQKNQTIDENNLSIKKYDWRVSKLKDTVTYLKSNIKDLKWSLNVTQADLTRKLNKKTDSLTVTKDSLQKANDLIVFYKGEMKRIEKLEWVEKRTRTQMKVGIVGVLVTWVAFTIAAIHQ